MKNWDENETGKCEERIEFGDCVGTGLVEGKFLFKACVKRSRVILSMPFLQSN